MISRRQHIISISLFTCSLLLFWACKHKPNITPHSSDGDFPPAVARIFVNKCATAGCHNAISYTAAGGLLLDSWEHLFDGGNTGAVVVPYSTDYSPLLYFINPDSTLGVVAEPQMPVNGEPLTTDEYLTIREWIAAGAPDKNGNIPFGSNPETRQKVYAIHQSCDQIAVIDVEKDIVMRYIPIGTKPYPESPTHIRTSPGDGRYAFVSMWYDHRTYKIDTYTDKVAGTADMGDLFWNVLHFSNDGQKLLVTNGDNYNLYLINTSSLQIENLTANQNLVNPHGIASTASFDTFYVTSMHGNTIYKISKGYYENISIDQNAPVTTGSAASPDPYDIIMSPDYSRYFIACEKSDEVRVMNAATDNLEKVIRVGTQPQTLTLSGKQPYLFVCCMEDNTAVPGSKGSVYVINYKTLEIVKKIEGSMYQPHSVTVDDRNNKFYIFSRNQNYDGPAPHHEGPCSGRNGFYTVYNLNTLELITKKRHEILVDPYISDIRFR